MMKLQSQFVFVLKKLIMGWVLIMTGICFLSTLNSLSSNLNSVQPKQSAFYVEYIVATSIIPSREMNHDLVTKIV